MLRFAISKPRVLLLILTLFGCVGMAGAQTDPQTERAHFRIRYVINRPEVDATFVDNDSRMTNMRDFLEAAKQDSLIRFTKVTFRGTASPDGAYDFNVWLCENRLRTFKELVYSYIDIPDSIIKSNTSDIPWDGFRKKVAESDIPHRDEVLAIIDEGPKLVPYWNNRRIDHRLLRLKKMYGGSVWEVLKSPILRDLRFGDAVFEYYHVRPLYPSPVVPFTNELQPVAAPASVPAFVYVEPEEEWIPRLHLKTNLIGLAMLNANFAVEVDMARHWSFTFPVYYCGMDWFKSTIKFRNFTIQPEFRYWFRRSDNDGFFLGAHFELSYYNFAFDGKYRFQDYRGRTPAIGGGLSAGYRMPISKNNRWRVEFTIGAGIYPLDYSLFDNTPDVRDGQWMSRNKKTYIGIDQAAITFAYSFDLKKRKKGGEK